MDMVIVAVLVACVLVVLLVIGLYERELRRMAHFLNKREKGSNERVAVEFATRGIREVVSAVNSELDSLRDARLEQEKRQQAFRQDLASLSHDIRTPLAGAQGYLQLYERTQDPAEKQRCLKEAASRLGAMRELTDTLFEYSKAIDTDNTLELEPVAFVPALAEVLAGAYPQFVEKGWEPVLVFDDDQVTVLANNDALSRVFSNLLTNALRHGVEAPHIEQQGSCMIFRNKVANPSAINPDQLFERFYQVDSARSSDGSGLGLAIVASLVKRMEGKISAQILRDELVIELKLKYPKEPKVPN